MGSGSDEEAGPAEAGSECAGSGSDGEAAGGAAGSTPPGEEAGVVDRADYDPDYDPDAPVICEVCGRVMEYTASCKLVCRNCGYMRDCSDP